MPSLTNTLIIETIFANPMQKKASAANDLVSAVKGYYDAHVDPNNQIEGLINLIAPSLIWELLAALGFGWWAPLAALAINVLDINIGELWGPLCDEVKEMLQSGKHIDSAQLNQTINQATQVATGADQAEANFSAAELLYYSKILKLALIDYQYQSLRLLKEPFNPSHTYLYKIAQFAPKKKLIIVLMAILGFILKTLLKSAGLLVAGDTIRKLEDKPSAHLLPQPSSSPSEAGSTQTKFTNKANDPLPAAVQMVNTPDNIEQMLIQFAKDTYNGLDGQESAIAASSNFQKIKDQIDWYNSHHMNSSVISIPPQYTSKKQLVDQFIDQVAAA